MLDKLAANRQERSLAVVVEAPSLLAGPVVDADGTIIHHDVRAGNVIKPIVSTPLRRRRQTSASREDGPGKTRKYPGFSKEQG